MTTNQNRLVLGAAAIGFAVTCTLACARGTGTSAAEPSGAAAPGTAMNAPAKESKVTLAVTGMTWCAPPFVESEILDSCAVLDRRTRWEDEDIRQRSAAACLSC